MSKFAIQKYVKVGMHILHEAGYDIGRYECLLGLLADVKVGIV